jgi:hypothetical protein
LAGVTRLLIHSGLLVADVYGQGLGSLSGTITDPVRPDNSLGDVTATVATDFGRSVTTGPDRCYMIPNLRPAGYVLTVQVQGFHHFSQTGITLQSDESALLNVKLEVRAATESIIVQASAVHVDFSLLSLEPNASRRY